MACTHWSPVAPISPMRRWKRRQVSARRPTCAQFARPGRRPRFASAHGYCFLRETPAEAPTPIPHASQIPRPVMVLGVDAPGAGHAALHDLTVTQDYYDGLPESLKQHLICRVVDKLLPLTQKHGIDGLLTPTD